MFIDKKINKLWYIHAMEFNTVMKMNELQVHILMWINLNGRYVKEFVAIFFKTSYSSTYSFE